MDTFIFAISKHNAFVCDYYQGEFKTLTFNKSDFYELYCYHDMSELIDYLNYPLNCKKFKDSDVIILYDEPIIYEYLYKNRERFRLANQVTLMHLKSAIWAYIAKRNKDAVYTFEGAFFQLTDHGIVSVAEEEEMESIAISLTDLSKMLINDEMDTLLLDDEAARDILRLQLNNHIDTEFKNCLVLAPATIHVTKTGEKTFLAVNDILVPESLIADGATVKVGEALFSYTHEVTKLLGKKQISVITKKAAVDGIFRWQDAAEDDIWAKKDAIVGVISAP
ncbi:hypothetical protein [Candidatus Epulonipiscium viviparus]|uniref:hypothetical protein n=1 Tax=Candidatus Epulonipiscium viviparus TaxID=420336 RepID=UPI00016C0DAE|nr:hypothetical protein [Candidatus Epulopiscium viviparus]